MEARECPWCKRWALKNISCNYIFACGLDFEGKFHVGLGCGRSWCFKCGGKFCGMYYNPETGKKNEGAIDNHTSDCCKKEHDFSELQYCQGGHDSHCDKRW